MRYLFIASGMADTEITREEARDLVLKDYNNGEEVFKMLEENGGDLRLMFGYLRVEKEIKE